MPNPESFKRSNFSTQITLGNLIHVVVLLILAAMTIARMQGQQTIYEEQRGKQESEIKELNDRERTSIEIQGRTVADLSDLEARLRRIEDKVYGVK